MFKANVYYTYGMGLEKGIIKAESYKELVSKVEKTVARLVTEKIRVFGEDKIAIIEKVVYNYPSGKSFIQKF